MLPLIIMVMLCAGCIGQAPESEWETDAQKALDRAKSENKSLLLFFFDAEGTAIIEGESVDPSDWMDKNTFSNKGVAQILRDKFVLVRLDVTVEKNRELATTYGGKVFPFYIVVDANGDTCRTFSGVMSADMFLKRIEGCYTPSSLLF